MTKQVLPVARTQTIGYTAAEGIVNLVMQLNTVLKELHENTLS